MYITTGVPQGSVLGPLLFLIYVNDIQNVIPGISVRLFADDTNVFIHDHDCHKLIDKTKNTLLTLQKWFDANKLTLHLGKTNYTIFHAKKKAHTCIDKFYIDNNVISKTSTTKYLGLIIDDELSWRPHVEDLCNKLIKYTGIFYRTRNHLPSNIELQLYYAFIYSRISLYIYLKINLMLKFC